MKKIFFLTTYFISATVLAQSIPVEDTAAIPAITAAGKPNGKIAEKKISAEGGTLVSGDGRLELIIPSDAISKKTTISIQPISNTMPNGNGQAYRLEPSGIQFKKPVKLIFHYSPDEATDSMQLLMGITMQDKAGQWHSLNKFNLDTVAKTIAGEINHFSDWSKFDAIKITPSSARLKVNRSILLDVSGFEPSPKEPDDADMLTPLIRSPKKAIWSVNEIVKGSPAVGTLTYGVTDRIEKGNLYKAPANVPNQNPVAVSARLQGLSWKFNGITFKDLRLHSNILVYDNAYEVSLVSSIDSPAPGDQLGTATYIDTGSFVVSLEDGKAKIIEKTNRNTTDNLNYKGDCIITLLKRGTGNIHITGVQNIKLVPAASPNSNPRVEIMFVLAPIRLSLVQMNCPPIYPAKNRTITTSSDKGMLSMVPAYPQYIKFEAKPGEQILAEMGTPGDLLYYKVTVRQLKDE